MSSSSSTDAESPPQLKAGDVVAGFRIERELEPGPAGRRVWEATQLSLDRRVLLEFLPAGQARLEDTEVLAARPTQHGLMVARQPAPRPVQLSRRSAAG